MKPLLLLAMTLICTSLGGAGLPCEQDLLKAKREIHLPSLEANPIGKGLFEYSEAGQILETGAAFPELEDDNYVYLLDRRGRLIFEKRVPDLAASGEILVTHRSLYERLKKSYPEGELPEIVGAGQFKILNGFVYLISNEAGTFWGRKVHLLHAIADFKARGLRIERSTTRFEAFEHYQVRKSRKKDHLDDLKDAFIRLELHRDLRYRGLMFRASEVQKRLYLRFPDKTAGTPPGKVSWRKLQPQLGGTFSDTEMSALSSFLSFLEKDGIAGGIYLHEKQNPALSVEDVLDVYEGLLERRPVDHKLHLETRAELIEAFLARHQDDVPMHFLAGKAKRLVESVQAEFASSETKSVDYSKLLSVLEEANEEFPFGGYVVQVMIPVLVEMGGNASSSSTMQPIYYALASLRLEGQRKLWFELDEYINQIEAALAKSRRVAPSLPSPVVEISSLAEARSPGLARIYQIINRVQPRFELFVSRYDTLIQEYLNTLEQLYLKFPNAKQPGMIDVVAFKTKALSEAQSAPEKLAILAQAALLEATGNQGVVAALWNLESVKGENEFRSILFALQKF
jgi:hypothetical protein